MEIIASSNIKETVKISGNKEGNKNFIKNVKFKLHL